MKTLKGLLLFSVLSIIHSLHGSLGLFQKGSPLRTPLDEKSRRYAASHMTEIKTIQDIEQSAEQFTRAMTAEKPHDYYPEPLIEELKREIRTLYIDAKMPHFIKQTAQECEALATTVTPVSDVDDLTEKFKQHWHIPNDVAYQPIISTFNKQIEQIIKRKALTNTYARAAKSQADVLPSIPTSLQELASAIQQFTTTSKLPDEADHKKIIDTFRDSLKIRMLLETLSKQRAALQLSIQKLAASTRATPITHQETQDLYQAEQENFLRLEQSLWQELLRLHYDEKLKQLRSSTPLTTLSQDQFDALLQGIKREVINDVQFFDLSPKLIPTMQDYIETSLKKHARNKALQVKEPASTKRTVTIHEAKNVFVDIPSREEINDEARDILFKKVQIELNTLLHDAIVHPEVTKKVINLILTSQQSKHSSQQQPITFDEFLTATNIPTAITNEQLQEIHDKVAELSLFSRQSRFATQSQTAAAAASTTSPTQPFHQRQELQRQVSAVSTTPNALDLELRFQATKKNVLSLLHNSTIDQQLLNETLRQLFSKLIQKNITIEQFIIATSTPETLTEKDFNTIDQVINRFEAFNQEIKAGKTAKTLTPAFQQSEKN